MPDLPSLTHGNTSALWISPTFNKGKCCCILLVEIHRPNFNFNFRNLFRIRHVRHTHANKDYHKSLVLNIGCIWLFFRIKKCCQYTIKIFRNRRILSKKPHRIRRLAVNRYLVGNMLTDVFKQIACFFFYIINISIILEKKCVWYYHNRNSLIGSHIKITKTRPSDYDK